MQESEVSQITKRMKGQRALTGYCYTDFWLMGFLALQAVVMSVKEQGCELRRSRDVNIALRSIMSLYLAALDYCKQPVANIEHVAQTR